MFLYRTRTTRAPTAAATVIISILQDVESSHLATIELYAGGGYIGIVDNSSVDREHVDVGREHWKPSKSIIEASDDCRDKVSEGNGGGNSLELLKSPESIAKLWVSEYRGTDKSYKCVCDDRTQNGVSAVSRQTVVFLLSFGFGMVMSIRNCNTLAKLDLEQ